MRSPILWAIIAVLVGVSIFGFYKSLELVTKNLVLANSLSVLKTELTDTQASLKATRQSLGEGYLKNAELEGKLSLMGKKLDKQAQDIKGYLEKMSLVSSKLQDAARANASLSAENRGIASQSIRLRLEAQEMRKKLSSIAELKHAIKDLKIKMKQDKRRDRILHSSRKRPIRSKKILEVFAQKEIIEQPVKGNAGFLMKSGRSTFSGFVDIQVNPEDESGVVDFNPTAEFPGF